MRHFAARAVPTALTLAVLAGCASVAPQPAPSAPRLAQTHVAVPDADHDVTTLLMDGQFALDHNKLKDAAKAYGKASALSNDPEVAERAAGLAMATHDFDAARTAIQRWATLGASPVQLAEARARLALDDGDTAGARAQLEKLVTSGDKDAWRVFGQLLLSGRDAAQSGQLLADIATPARLPDDPKAWLAMSEMGAKLGRQAYARHIASAAVTRFHCADCYAWSAQMAFEKGDHAKARDLYAKAVAKAPKNARLRLGYASLLGQLGDNKAALRTLSAGPQTVDTYQARAAYAARANDRAGLAKVYAQLEKAPDDVQAKSAYLMGQLAGSLGKPKQALRWFDDVPADDAHRFDADLHSALLWQQLKQPGKARAIAGQMQLDYADSPKHLAKAIELEANLDMMAQRYADAADAYDRALKLEPDNDELLYARGLAYAESGKVDEAVADLRRVLQAKPDDIEVINALGFTLADANRDLPEAEKLIARAHKAQPKNPAITDSWGWLQYRLGHLDAAHKALQASWQAQKDPDVGGHLAEVLWKQGDVRAAERVLTEARKMAPDDARLSALQKKIAP